MNNISWEDVTSSVEDGSFNEWEVFQNIFGEFGVPGFTEQILSIRSPKIFGYDDNVDVRFTLYRAEDGSLLFIHGCYINKDNLQTPYLWAAHPNHRRKGLGTMMADYVIERYKKERGSDYTYEESLRNVKYNNSSAAFTNKYVKNVYNS